MTLPKTPLGWILLCGWLVVVLVFEVVASERPLLYHLFWLPIIGFAYFLLLGMAIRILTGKCA